MKVRNLIAIKPMTGGINLNFNPCPLRGAQLPGVFERRDWIAFSKMHQHRAPWPFARKGTDLGRVIANGCSCAVDVRRTAPGHCATPAISERGNFPRPGQLLHSHRYIRECLLPRNPAAQIAAGDRVLFRITEHDSRTDAVEQGRCNYVKALGSIHVTNEPYMIGHAKNFLQ